MMWFRAELWSDSVGSFHLLVTVLTFVLYILCMSSPSPQKMVILSHVLALQSLRNSFSLQDPHRHLSLNFLTKPSCKWTQSAVSSISDPPLLYIYHQHNNPHPPSPAPGWPQDSTHLQALAAPLGFITKGMEGIQHRLHYRMSLTHVDDVRFWHLGQLCFFDLRLVYLV